VGCLLWLLARRSVVAARRPRSKARFNHYSSSGYGPLVLLDTEASRAVFAATMCNRLAVRMGAAVRAEPRHFRQCAPAITVVAGPIDSFQWTCRGRDSNVMKRADGLLANRRRSIHGRHVETDFRLSMFDRFHPVVELPRDVRSAELRRNSERSRRHSYHLRLTALGPERDSAGPLTAWNHWQHEPSEARRAQLLRITANPGQRPPDIVGIYVDPSVEIVDPSIEYGLFAAARQLTPAQLADAQKAARDWLAAFQERGARNASRGWEPCAPPAGRLTSAETA
jgi:hypothetical protein